VEEMREYIFLKNNEELNWEKYIELADNLAKIDKTYLETELGNHASIFAYYSGLLNESKAKSELTQHYLDKMEADIRSREDAKYRLENKSKPTDKYLESKVLSDEGYSRLKEDKLTQDHRFNLLKGLISSLEHRKDCLIQISSNSRKEMAIYG
jgi:hypothetical protein